MEIYSLKNFSKDEILDIYWNLKYGIWDRRIGKMPAGYNKAYCHRDFSKKYIEYIEKKTTPKERKRYQMVVIHKDCTESEFEKYWENLKAN